MIPLSDLLFEPVTLPPALHGHPGSAGVLPVAGAFAATLAGAVAERELPLPQTETPENTGFAVLRAVPEGQLEALGEMLTTHAEGAGSAPAVTAMQGVDGAIAAPLALLATTTEGTGQGRPSGNGLPPPGAEGGKALPDLPLPRIQPAPVSAAASHRQPVPHVEPAVAMPLPDAEAAARTELMVSAEARPAAVTEAAMLAAREARLVAEGARHVATPAASRPGMEAPAPTGAPVSPAATAAAPAAAPSQTGTLAADVHMGALAEAPPKGQQAAAAVADGARGGEAESGRQLGAVERRALDPFAEISPDARRGLAPDGQINLPRSDTAPVADAVAASAMLDRRAIAEAAGQRRAAGEPPAPAEPADRTPATGTESAEQSSRSQTARAAVPVLATRDLAALAERIETLIHRRGGVANVNLRLEELGDVEISVRLESRQAHVQFVVQDAAVRESLEAQLPRLRALLGEGGLELGDIGMNTREQSDGNAGRGADESERRRRAVAEHLAVEEPMPRRRSGGEGRILDAFA